MALKMYVFSRSPSAIPLTLNCIEHRASVVGAIGNNGKLIVTQLLSKGFNVLFKGFNVKAGVCDVDSVKNNFPTNDTKIQFVKVNVIEGVVKLSEVIGNVEVFICTMGFRPSLDFLAPWKVDNFSESS